MTNVVDGVTVRPPRKQTSEYPTLAKAPTGIEGLDEVTGGGLPRGRATLICGPAGSGKTLLAMEFLVRGITEYNEPGVFLAFEESTDDLIANVASMGFDLGQMQRDGKLKLDHVQFMQTEIEEIGEWDLTGLFLRLGAAIDEVGAKRVVIDTIETLFGSLSNTSILRSELHRLFRWLKSRGVTAVITGEKGDGGLTRHGIEEYVSDCVIALDHRVVEQSSTRRLRVVKYRGSLHGTNEYPFLIGRAGVSVLPVTSARLPVQVWMERVPTGVARLDAMLGDGGYYKGTSVLISGQAGTGKTTFGAQFCAAACSRGQRALYFAFEESDVEIVRNMNSVGINLEKGLGDGSLEFRCSRPSRLGLEAHLLDMQRAVVELKPDVVVIDPISELLRIGSAADVTAMLTRQLDFMKGRGVTALLTTLTADALAEGLLASLVDSWMVVESKEGNGEHNRLLYIHKARGIAHSNQIREFFLTSSGIELADVYVGPQGVLTGSARQSQEAKERSDTTARLEDLELRRSDLRRQREGVEARTANLWREYEDEAENFERLIISGSTNAQDRAGQRAEQGRLRDADEELRPPVSRPSREVPR